MYCIDGLMAAADYVAISNIGVEMETSTSSTRGEILITLLRQQEGCAGLEDTSASSISKKSSNFPYNLLEALISCPLPTSFYLYKQLAPWVHLLVLKRSVILFARTLTAAPPRRSAIGYLKRDKAIDITKLEDSRNTRFQYHHTKLQYSGIVKLHHPYWVTLLSQNPRQQTLGPSPHLATCGQPKSPFRT